MNTQTKESIDKLLELDEKSSKPENKDDMELMDEFWDQVRVVLYNLISELYEGEDSEEVIQHIVKMF